MPRVKRAVPPRDVMPNVLKVLELIVSSIKQPKKKRAYLDIFSSNARDKPYPGRIKTVGKTTVELVTKCIQSHRYEEAAKLLWITCQESCIFDPFLFKAIMTVLENLHYHDKNETITKIFSGVHNLDLINKKEANLEYIIYGLKVGVQDLQSLSKEMISTRVKIHLRKNPVVDPILDGYCALLKYIDWHKSLKGEVLPSQGKEAAENAILIFKKIIQQAGQWDIFVLKLVEMLEFYERHDEVETVLLQYIEQNPKNVNAYIYLCEYLQKHNQESKNLIKFLKSLAELCPSDARVLLLVEKLNELDKKMKKRLKILFMFLDYPLNGKNIQAWKMLSEILLQAITRKKTSSSKFVRSWWKKRYSCWNWIYFTTSNLSILSETERELVSYKVIVLSILDPSHEYIEQVLMKFSSVAENLPEFCKNMLVCKDSQRNIVSGNVTDADCLIYESVSNSSIEC